MQSQETDNLIKIKSLLNKRINSVIKQLISLKRGINGKGDQKAGIPATSIKEPLPDELNSLISLINTSFPALLQLCGDIISKQDSLAESKADENIIKHRKQQVNITNVEPAKKTNRSTDPEQDQLRQLKVDWSNYTSKLISLLIVLKKGMNGIGDSGYNIPSFSIKEPFPTEVKSLISESNSYFNQVMSVAKNIYTKQQQYSLNRTKSKNEINPMDKTASNWFSRNWARISQYPLFKEDPLYKHRMGILLSAAQAIKDLHDIQDSLLAQNTELNTTVNKFNTSINSFIMISLTELKELNKYYNRQQAENKKEQEQALDRLNVIIKDLEYDFSKELQTLDVEIYGEIIDQINEFRTQCNEILSNSEKTPINISDIENKYQNIINYIKNKLNLNDSKISTLEDIINHVKQTSIKQANNKITRFLNKKILALNSDNISRVKIICVRNLDELINYLDQLQDTMENKKSTINDIKNNINNVLVSADSTIDTIIGLIETYDGSVKSDKSYFEDKNKTTIKPVAPGVKESIKRLKVLINKSIKVLGNEKSE